MVEQTVYNELLNEERRLRAAIEEDLNLRLRQQEAIAWLGEYALRCRDLDTLLDETVRLVVDTLGMEFCKILEQMPDGHSLLLRAGKGWADGLVGQVMVGMEHDSQAGFALLSDEPVIVQDLNHETRFSSSRLLLDHHVVSGMSVVIPGKEQPFGVLSAHTAQQRNIIPLDARFIKAIAGILGSAIERFSTEDALRRSRDELSIILEGINEGVTVQDLAGRLVFSNQAAAEIMGFATAEEAMSAGLQDIQSRFQLLDEDGGPFPYEKLPGRLVMQGAPRAAVRIRFRVAQTGEEHWSIIDASPIRDAEGRVVQSVNIFRNITEMVITEHSQRFLAQVGELLASSIDYKTTLTNVAQLAVTHLADWCSIHLLNEWQEIFQLTVAHRNPNKAALAETYQKRYPPDYETNQGVGYVLRSGEAVYFPDIPEELLEKAAVDAEHLALIREVGMRSAMIVPLKVRDNILGAITLVWADSGRHYTQRDVELANELARRAAMAIDNARLYHDSQLTNAELELRVARRTQELIKTNAQLEREVDERRRTEVALQKSEAMLHSLFESAPDGILLVNQEGSIVRANYQAEVMFGFSRADLSGMPVEHLIPARFERRRLRRRGQYLQDLVLRASTSGLELTGQRVGGEEFPVEITLNLVKTEDGEMTICAVRNMTVQKRLQMELAETHRRLFESVEAERLRISQDLHDGPIQELYGVALYFEMLREVVQTPDELDEFDKVKESIQGIIQSLRGICGELRPPTLNLGLDKAIRSYLGKLRETHPDLLIETHLSADGRVLSERERLALYRIFQNAVSNILRHAQASTIVVRFSLDEGQAELTIQDDGIGFLLPGKWVDLARENHFGLVGMAERVQAIGGDFTIDSVLGKGTTVRVVLPLSQPQALAPADPVI